MPTIDDRELGLVSVRAKFFVKKIEYYTDNSRQVVLAPVYSQDPNHENKQFWDAAPNGELTMIINNPRAAEFFIAGREYYIDFTNPPKMADLTAREEMARVEGAAQTS